MGVVESNEPGEVDVIVAGSGAAGLMAALEAADAGASVALLESEAEIGGSTRLSGAYVALCETAMQPGTREELLADLREAHHGDAQDELSRLYVDHAGDMCRRLDELGIRFVRTFQFAHMSKPWAHELSGDRMGGGAEIVDRLAAAVLQRGISIQTSTAAQRLVIEGGRVEGVRLRKDKIEQTLRARRGVVLATGGFTRNADLIRNFGRPGAEQILPLTGAGSRGDGLRMAMAVGAGTSYMTVGVAPTAPTDPETGKGVMVVYAGAIALNKQGVRFCRESDLYIDICWAALGQPDGTFVQIYDQPMRDAYSLTMMGKVLTGFREIRADTIEELAEALRQYGFDAEGVAASVRSYNADMREGLDQQFGRAGLVGDSGVLRAVETGPFYAVICRAGTTHFNGGLTVGVDMQVCDVFGDRIAGLYAAGETTGGFHGAGYMSGTFVGMALISGRVAGRSAATAPIAAIQALAP